MPRPAFRPWIHPPGMGLSLIVSVAAGAVGAENIIFPADAGVVSVVDFGALPDDGVDDTAAIQAAMDAVSFDSSGNPFASGSNNHILYFPNGRYDVSDMLVYPGAQKRLIFQGQSRDGVVLALKDDLGWAEGDGKSILRTGSGTADRFRNAVRDMTFDTGVGNPYASGLQFFASNQGTVRNVTIRSGDGQGRAGLDMAWDDAIGPLLVEDVLVEGFDVGVDTRWQTASQTFENLTVRHQNQYGFRNRNNQAVFIRGFVSEQRFNSIPAAANLSNSTEAMVITDAQIAAQAGASSSPAIINQRNLFVADVAVAGYAKAILNDISAGRGNADVIADYVEEYAALGVGGPNFAGSAISAFPSPSRSLRLPVKDSPVVPWEQDLNRWAGPHHFGGNGSDSTDDTAAIQAAIDSGASTVYLPNGRWIVNGTLRLRGGVTRLLGTEAILETTDGNGRIVVEDAAPGSGGDAEVVAIERMQSGLGSRSVEVLQNTDRTLVLNSLSNFTYLTHPDVADPGELFINDYVGAVAFRDQDVWARQLNTEQDTEQDAGDPLPDRDARIVNDGGRVWLSGVKTEKDGTVVKTINGGATELLGTFHAGSGYSQTDPRFLTIDSSFSAAVWVDQVGGSGRFDVFARETRNGVTRTVNLPSGPGPNLYSAFAFTDTVDAPELWLNASGDTADSSGFGHYAKAGGGLSYGPGVAGGQGFIFDGVDDDVDITTGVLEQPLEARTVAMFIRPDGLTGTATLFDEGGAANGLALGLDGDELIAAVVAGTRRGKVSAPLPGPGPWVHVALVFDRGELTLFINGDEAASVDAGVVELPWHGGDRSALGSGLDTGVLQSLDPAGFGPYAGGMDDVRLWGVALKPWQIDQLASMIPGPGSAAAGLLGAAWLASKPNAHSPSRRR